jgi:hypothetical protein
MAIGNQPSQTSNVASKTISVIATSGQTLFTVTGGYRINQLAVYRNGVRLVDGRDYTARDGSTVTLVYPAAEFDALEFQIFDDFRVADAIVSSASEQTIYGNLTVNGTLTGATIGIQSAGVDVGVAKTLNFVGYGNTFAVNDGVIDVTIQGGRGGGLGNVINYQDGSASPFSYIDKYENVTENLDLDNTIAGPSTSYIVTVVPNIIINSGIGVTIGAGKTMVIDILRLGDL